MPQITSNAEPEPTNINHPPAPWRRPRRPVRPRHARRRQTLISMATLFAADPTAHLEGWGNPTRRPTPPTNPGHAEPAPDPGHIGTG